MAVNTQPSYQNIIAVDPVDRARLDLLRRQELEAQRRAEEEFLRTSLRGSERLRALESAQRIRGSGRRIQPVPLPRIQGHENAAFREDEAGPEEDLGALISRLCRDANEKVEEAEWMKNFLNSAEFRQAFLLHQVMQRALIHYEGRKAQPERQNATAICKAIESSFPQVASRNKTGPSSAYTHQLYELNRLLSSVVIKKLLWTHDELAERWYPNWAQKQKQILDQIPKPDAALLAAVNRSVTPEQPFQDPYSLSKKTPIPGASSRSDDISISSADTRNQQTFSTRDGTRIKTVTLEKGAEALGATVKNEGQAVVIGRIIAGGLAYKTGFLQEGDEILSINGVSVYGKTVDEVSDFMADTRGTVKFILRPVDSFVENVKRRRASLHVRALFTYNPTDDVFIPCPEMGLTFEKGDIIHIINTTDANWWQGYLEESSIGNVVSSDFSPPSSTLPKGRLLQDDDSIQTEGARRLAHLVPSPDFQRHREGIQRRQNLSNKRSDLDDKGKDMTKVIETYDLPEMGGAVPIHFKPVSGSARGGDKNPSSGTSSTFHCCRRRPHGGRSKDRYYPDENDVPMDEDIPTYERVELYYPQPARKRPIVIVGPSLMGRRELVSRLVDRDRDRFDTVISFTTRLTSAGMLNGHRYVQVSKQEFDHLLSVNQLIEYGEYENNFYGVSKQSILEIIQQGKVCVLSLSVGSLKALRATNFLPYVIFLSPPPAITQLRKLVREVSPTSTEVVSDDQLLEIREAARRMEARYGHLFDHVMVHERMDSSGETLLAIADRLETEAQWICREWLMARSTSPLTPLVVSPGDNRFSASPSPLS